MAKILIVMTSLTSGGAEKSLINFLNNPRIKKYDIDLLLFRREGLFIEHLPENVNLINAPIELELLYGYVGNIIEADIKISSKISFLLKRVIVKIAGFLNSKQNKSPSFVWDTYKKSIKDLKGEYDLAIAYMQTHPIYFVVDKVRAKKKFGWMHSTFKGSELDINYERLYYNKLDTLYVVSEKVYKEINTTFTERNFGLKIFQNVIYAENIIELSKVQCQKIFTTSGTRFLTIGRLAYPKGYDIMLSAFKLLYEKGIEFELVIIGEGSMYSELISFINSNNMNKCIKFIGIKENPYKYLNQCDIYVQTSRYEGYGIAIVEAKILGKPLLLTNFSTAELHVSDKKNGLIVDLKESSVVKGAISMINNLSKFKVNAEAGIVHLNYDEQFNLLIDEIDEIRELENRVKYAR